MVASGRVAYLAKRGAEYGVKTSVGEGNEVEVVMEKVRQRKRNIVDSFRGGGEKRLRDAGVDALMGKARFVDQRTVEVRMNDQNKDGEIRTLTADRIFINTGERPARPDIEGLYENPSNELASILDSTSIQELDMVPDHLVVLGGGYIGLEFGQLFRRLGARVTIIQRGKRLLAREDPEVAQMMLDILIEDGIEVHLKTQAKRIQRVPPQERDDSSAFKLTIQHDQSEEIEIKGSHLLLATGREPSTDSLNLGAANVQTTPRGHIIVNSQLETTAPGIYALGDVKGGPAFTHISYDDYRILNNNVIEKGKNPNDISTMTTKDRLVPYVVYTDPQLGHIGLHAHSVVASRSIQVATMPMSYVARALETAETRGVMKAVVDKNTKQILGFTCLGMEGGEVMSMVQMAMMGHVEWTRLRDAVWAHPSWAEGLNNLWGFLKDRDGEGEKES